MSSTASEPTASEPISRAQLRYALLPNVRNATTIHAKLFARATQRITEYAARFGITEPAIVDRERLEHHFRALASMLLTHFAKRVLGSDGVEGGAARTAKWSVMQAARVRAPFDLYGLLDGDTERTELDPRLEDAPARLRRAILEGGAPEYEYLTPSHIERFLEDATELIKVGMPDGLRQGHNPPAVLATLGSTCTAVRLRQRPDTVRAHPPSAPHPPGVSYIAPPVRCSLTGRVMQPGERVVRFRLVGVGGGGDSGETGDEGAPLVYENAVDYALASERLRPDAGPLPQYLSTARVSDLLVNILNYTVSYHWIIGLYNTHIQQICEYAAGNISSEVLEAQRQKNAAVRRAATTTTTTTTTKNTVVLKVGSRDQVEQCFSAFELGTFTGHALETLVELFVRFKKLQIHYLIACECIRRIQQH